MSITETGKNLGKLIPEGLKKLTIRTKSREEFIRVIEERGGIHVDANLYSRPRIPLARIIFSNLLVEDQNAVPVWRVTFISTAANGRKIRLVENFVENPTNGVNETLATIKEKLPNIRTRWHLDRRSVS